MLAKPTLQFQAKPEKKKISELHLDKYDKMILTDLNKIAERENLVDVYITGGWVRDKLMGMEALDFDIVIGGENGLEKLTKAIDDFYTNHQVMSRIHPPSAASIDEYPMKGTEIISIKYKNTENNKNYGFGLRKLDGNSIEEDCYSRDFTINSIYYNIRKFELYSPVDGIEHLEEGLIKTVNEVQKTFYRSPSRVFRFFTLLQKYRFKVDRKLEIYLKNIDYWEDFHERYAKLYPHRLKLNVKKLIKDKNVCDILRRGQEYGFEKFFTLGHDFEKIDFGNVFNQMMEVFELLPEKLDTWGKDVVRDYYNGRLPPNFYLKVRCYLMAFVVGYYDAEWMHEFLEKYMDFNQNECKAIENFFDYLSEEIENPPQNFMSLVKEQLKELTVDVQGKWTILFVVMAYGEYCGNGITGLHPFG